MVGVEGEKSVQSCFFNLVKYSQEKKSNPYGNISVHK